jgi:hypothetical protein
MSHYRPRTFTEIWNATAVRMTELAHDFAESSASRQKIRQKTLPTATALPTDAGTGGTLRETASATRTGAAGAVIAVPSIELAGQPSSANFLWSPCNLP